MPMIDEAMIRRVCERTGCSPTAARRVSLGLAPSDRDRSVIVRAFIEEGADPRFLTELSEATTGTRGIAGAQFGPLDGWRSR